MSQPLIASAKSLELLRKHTAKGHHKDSVVKADKFEKVMTHKQPDIQCRLDQVRADRIALNRRKLSSIFQTVLLCGRQNIPLRGHRDNLTDVESDSQQDANHGNFHALLQFRIEAGDTVLGEHPAHGSRNAMYTSSVIQNQIIDILADQIRQKILEKVITAQWYTVVADEVSRFPHVPL